MTKTSGGTRNRRPNYLISIGVGNDVVQSYGTEEYLSGIVNDYNRCVQEYSNKFRKQLELIKSKDTSYYKALKKNYDYYVAHPSLGSKNELKNYIKNNVNKYKKSGDSFYLKSNQFGSSVGDHLGSNRAFRLLMSEIKKKLDAFK